ncbi:MAG: Lrp/AsnC family transcriptional regulator [Gammaproteobacteria bacterium]
MKLDAIDVRILARLQQEGRIAKTQLAEHANLSPSACFRRVERLMELGYIRGYRAQIEYSRILSIDLVIVEITLESHHFEDFERFENAIREVPEVTECIAVGGGLDYIVKFAVTSIAHYQELFEELLKARIGIDKYYSYIATRLVKSQAEPPVEHLLARARRDAERN